MIKPELSIEERKRAIVFELVLHNEDIGADPAPEDWLAEVAEYVDMVRNQGISVETLCMMLVDIKRARIAAAVALAKLNGRA